MVEPRLQLPNRCALAALFAIGAMLVDMILWDLWKNNLLSGKVAARKERLKQELNEILRDSMCGF